MLEEREKPNRKSRLLSNQLHHPHAKLDYFSYSLWALKMDVKNHILLLWYQTLLILVIFIVNKVIGDRTTAYSEGFWNVFHNVACITEVYIFHKILFSNTLHKWMTLQWLTAYTMNSKKKISLYRAKLCDKPAINFVDLASFHLF